MMAIRPVIVISVGSQTRMHGPAWTESQARWPNRPSYLEDSRRKCWLCIMTSPWPQFHRQVHARNEEKGAPHVALSDGTGQQRSTVLISVAAVKLSTDAVRHHDS